MKKKKIALALGASVAASASLLAATSSERYVYDASGNIVEKQIGEQVTQFDYAGNLLKGSVLNAAQKQYQYDEAGRLVGELKEGQIVRELDYQFSDKVTNVQAGENNTELFYNAEGHLVGTNSAGSLEVFAWDGLAMVSRGEQAYANEAHVVGGVPALIGSDVAVSDMIGSTLSVGDESFEASAFGEGLEEGLFTGKPYVEELGSFIFKFRNYSLNGLRWETADLSGFPDGSNNYTYAKNSPLIYFDKLGLSCGNLEDVHFYNVSVTCDWDDNNSSNDTTVTIVSKVKYSYSGEPSVTQNTVNGILPDNITASSLNSSVLTGTFAWFDEQSCDNNANRKTKWKGGTIEASCQLKWSYDDVNELDTAAGRLLNAPATAQFVREN